MRTPEYVGLIPVLLFASASLTLGLPQKRPSDKDLFEKSQTEFAAGKLDEAYASITSARMLKKKPEKKYEELFTKVSQQLADREATKGERACKDLDLVTCEQQLKKAQPIANTAAVSRLETIFDTEIKNVRTKANDAVDQGRTDPERGLAELTSLRRFSPYLPDLNFQIQQMQLTAVNNHMNAATTLIKEMKWDEAAQQYDRVFAFTPNHEGAKAGLATIERLQKDFQRQAEAEATFNMLDYRKALAKINLAVDSSPEMPEFQNTKRKIITEGSQALLDSMDRLLSKPEDLGMTRQAYLNVQQLRGLNPSHPKLPEYLTKASEDFGANLLQRASEYEALLDYSMLGTASVMKVKAQNLLSSATVKLEEIKEVIASFNRRRSSQIIFSVEDLAGADPVFVQTVMVRTRSALEGAELPDLRIRSLDEYRKSPNEDPIVKGLSPDGKSSTVQFVVQITNHQAQRKPSQKELLKSQYVSGVEQIPNPEYVRLKQESDKIRRNLDDPKQKKEKLNNEHLFAENHAELSRVDHLLPKEKLTDYTYEKITYTQHIGIEIKLLLRDNATREIISSERIVATDDRTDQETTGVHDKDNTGARNRPLTLVPEQQALRELGQSVLNEITTKTLVMLPNYTRRFYKEGESALKSDRTDEAVENFIYHWAFFRGKLDQAELEPLAEVILRQTGFDLSSEGSRFLSLAVRQ